MTGPTLKVQQLLVLLLFTPVKNTFNVPHLAALVPQQKLDSPQTQLLVLSPLECWDTKSPATGTSAKPREEMKICEKLSLNLSSPVTSKLFNSVT